MFQMKHRLRGRRKCFLSVPERLEHQTQMLLVVEVSEQTEAVELVVRICVVQLLEEF